MSQILLLVKSNSGLRPPPYMCTCNDVVLWFSLGLGIHDPEAIHWSLRLGTCLVGHCSMQYMFQVSLKFESKEHAQG
jgi:hypothetical protein